MKNLEIILTIAIPIYSFIVIFLGVWIGHKLTLKAFAHVQPSTKDMAKMGTSPAIVSTEPDYFEEAMKEPPYESTPEEESSITKLFKKAKIPKAIYQSYKNKGRDPREFLGYDVPFNKQSVEDEIKKESV